MSATDEVFAAHEEVAQTAQAVDAAQHWLDGARQAGDTRGAGNATTLWKLAYRNHRQAEVKLTEAFAGFSAELEAGE